MKGKLYETFAIKSVYKICFLNFNLNVGAVGQQSLLGAPLFKGVED
jgi:hypothetical protein